MHYFFLHSTMLYAQHYDVCQQKQYSKISTKLISLIPMKVSKKYCVVLHQLVSS